MDQPAKKVRRRIWRDNALSEGERTIPVETAVALTYNGGSYAVMMATPQDMEDFAIGFSLSEGIVSHRDEIESFDIVPNQSGIELRMWIKETNAARLQQRRRHIAGPTGCGLCGIDSLEEATRPAAIVGAGRNFSAAQIMSAMQALAPLQKLNVETRAVHAAAFWNLSRGIVALREDVGRHNALDKLAGAVSKSAVAVNEGIVLLTSRISVEMVQKTAAMGVPTLVSVSAPTSLAVSMADTAGITLAAIARSDGFEIFTHPHRISLGDEANVA